MLSPELVSELSAILTVVLIDIVLAGDNAVVVGLAAAGLPARQQRIVIMIGVGLALGARILFSLVAIQLLAIIGLVLAGGLLLLWVAWKMFRELQRGTHAAAIAAGAGGAGSPADVPAMAPAKSFSGAIVQIAIADISMSLDNVLAVAGAAREHLSALIIGLVLSIALMGVAAGYIARWMERFRWLAWAGFVIVLWVALRMIWDGGQEVMHAATRAGML
jgi:YjbE family integral membrane protein